MQRRALIIDTQFSPRSNKMHVHDPDERTKKPCERRAEQRLTETVQVLTCVQRLLDAVYGGNTAASASQHSALAHLGLEMPFLRATPAMRVGGNHE